MRKIFNNKGLTLIEIIVTLAVLGIVVTPLMNMFIASQKINNESSEEYVTLQIAQKHLENIKSVKKIHELFSKGYMELGGGYYSVPNPGEDLPYKVKVKITPDSSMSSVSNKSNDGVPVITIYNNVVEWKSSIGSVRTQTIIDGTVDITIGQAEVAIFDQSYMVTSSDINIVLETLNSVEPKLNFINCTESSRVFLTDNGRKWSFEVFGDKVPQIINVVELSADKVLYQVEVEVYRGSGADEKLVKSLRSTSIF